MSAIMQVNQTSKFRDFLSKHMRALKFKKISSTFIILIDFFEKYFIYKKIYLLFCYSRFYKNFYLEAFLCLFKIYTYSNKLQIKYDEHYFFFQVKNLLQCNMVAEIFRHLSELSFYYFPGVV